MPERDRKLPDERGEFGIEQRPLDRLAADRVRPVADDHPHAVAPRRAQAVGHRVDVGVDARAHVLEIDDQQVEAVEHRRRRFPRVAVQRVDRNAEPWMPGMSRFHHVVLDVGMESVLRPEQRRECRARQRRQPVRDVTEGAVDRRRVRDQSDARPVKEAGIEQTFGSESDQHR